MLVLEVALERVLAGIVPLPVVRVGLEAATGRVLAAHAVARVSLPPWDNSSMDGFAVRASDVAAATAAHPVEVPVVGEVAAGHLPPGPLQPGTAMRITTGAMMPDGADAVVPVEETDAEAAEAALPDRVAVLLAPKPGAYVRQTGEDVQAGAVILPGGRAIGPAALALLAAAGVERVDVHRRPRVAVLATGDELVAPGEPLGPARLYDSNSLALVAQAAAAGAIARAAGIVPDAFDAMVEAIEAAVTDSDVIVLSGGVSVGAHDVVKRAFTALGRVDFWRVAIQPGKPMAFGHIERPDGPPVVLFGLPGNPVSAFVTFELFVRPVLLRLAGHAGLDRARVRARLASPVTKAPGRRAFLRVTVTPDPMEDGRLVATLAGGQGSHVLSALAAANGLAIVPESVDGLPEGAEVEVLRLDEEGA